jgi:hypothetical protein
LENALSLLLLGPIVLLFGIPPFRSRIESEWVKEAG